MNKKNIIPKDIDLLTPHIQKQRDHVTISDLYYSVYKKMYSMTVTKKQYVSIAILYFKYTMNKIIEGTPQRIPRLGEFKILGKKIEIRRDKEGNIRGLINWKKTNDLWDKNPEAKKNKKYVYYLNEHSDGYVYTLVWSKRNINIRNKFLYYFRPTRTNKRLIAKKVFEGQKYPNHPKYT